MSDSFYDYRTDAQKKIGALFIADMRGLTKQETEEAMNKLRSILEQESKIQTETKP